MFGALLLNQRQIAPIVKLLNARVVKPGNRSIKNILCRIIIDF